MRRRGSGPARCTPSGSSTKPPPPPARLPPPALLTPATGGSSRRGGAGGRRRPLTAGPGARAAPLSAAWRRAAAAPGSAWAAAAGGRCRRCRRWRRGWGGGGGARYLPAAAVGATRGGRSCLPARPAAATPPSFGAWAGRRAAPSGSACARPSCRGIGLSTRSE